MWHSAQNKSPFKKKNANKIEVILPETCVPFKISHDHQRWTSLIPQQRPPGASRWLIPLDLHWTCQPRLVVLVEELRFCVSRSRELLWRNQSRYAAVPVAADPQHCSPAPDWRLFAAELQRSERAKLSQRFFLGCFKSALECTVIQSAGNKAWIIFDWFSSFVCKSCCRNIPSGMSGNNWIGFYLEFYYFRFLLNQIHAYKPSCAELLFCRYFSLLCDSPPPPGHGKQTRCQVCLKLGQKRRFPFTLSVELFCRL